jgi:hypothetical protein
MSGLETCDKADLNPLVNVSMQRPIATSHIKLTTDFENTDLDWKAIYPKQADKCWRHGARSTAQIRPYRSAAQLRISMRDSGARGILCRAGSLK